MLLVASSAVMARLNYFEWMFHPVDGPRFLAQADSKLDAKEMIMAVRLGTEARAYPISQMAYHHVLNDVVAGVPIAVTY
jgi:predicted N-acyltransferase